MEEYGSSCYTEEADGTLLFSIGYTNRENLISWLLSFGDKAELLEPEELRRELARLGKGIWEKYDLGSQM